MKRLGMLVAATVVILATVLPAAAQQPNFTVTFGGQMRVYGLVWDNFTDFTDTGKQSNIFAPSLIGRAKDSESYYFQRWRLYTTVESADKNARVVWAIEVGDITWGLGGGASGDEYGTGTNARNGTSQGGGLGADGANVETKNLYLQFNIPGLPNSNILLGAHNIVFMTSPAGAFMDDDGWGIQLNFKWDPVDLQLYTVKIDENTRASADDNDFYAARLGFNLTPDTRFTVEGLLANTQCMARRGVAAGAPAGTLGSCVSTDFGDNFWIGATAATKVGPASLHFSGVYGQRKLFSASRSAAGLSELIEESGYGFQFVAQVPIGPLATWWHAWYETGDKTRITGGGCEDVTAHPACTSLPTGLDFTTNNNSTKLVGDTDRLPLPDTQASWSSVPYVMEFIRGLASIGAPGFGSTHYSDSTGTWGIGGSAIYSITPAFSVGGGVGYLAAVEDTQGCAFLTTTGAIVTSRCGGGVYGDWVFEFDAGVVWRYNPNLTISLLAGYAVPDEGDDAWGLTFRTQFSF
jgi:hypothetical protein